MEDDKTSGPSSKLTEPMKKMSGKPKPKSKTPPKRKSKSPNEGPSDLISRPSTTPSNSTPVMDNIEKMAIGAFEDYYNAHAHKLSINTVKFKMGNYDEMAEYTTDGRLLPNPDKKTYMGMIFDDSLPEQDLNEWFPTPSNHRYENYYGDADQDYHDKTVLGAEYENVQYTAESLNQNVLEGVGWKTPSWTKGDFDKSKVRQYILKGTAIWTTNSQDENKEEDHVAINVTVPNYPSFNKNVILFFSPSGQNTMYENNKKE